MHRIIWLFILGTSPCSIHAECYIANADQKYACVCYFGYAGNGFVCGEDSDLDGYPDESLTCNDKMCDQVGCCCLLGVQLLRSFTPGQCV